MSRLRWLTAGESHGPALVATLEGLPAGVPVTTDMVADALARRRLGHGRGARMKFERDEVTFLGGVRHGLSLGSPVAIMVGNTEWPKWEKVMAADMSKATYKERAATHPSPVAAKLFNIMHEKQTNLCASLDVRTTKELLELVEALGPKICLLKTHVDILTDFSMEGTVKPLKALSAKYNFLLFEDRKFADIGNTVKLQYSAGVYRIAEWADITNAHGVVGPGIVSGLKQAAEEVTKEPRGLLMLAELSCKGSLATGEYTKGTVDIAKSDKDFVIGFIAQRDMGGRDEGYDWLIMTPGVGLDDKGDALGQQYRTVDDVVSTGSDIIIVGRGLFAKGRDAKVEGERYRKAGWEAYLRRCGQQN